MSSGSGERYDLPQGGIAAGDLIMKRTFAVLAAILLLALIAGLLWKRRSADEPAAAGKPDAAAGGASSKTTAPGPKVDPDPATAASDPAPQLHGLRRLPLETAKARGWTPPPLPPELSDPVLLTYKRLRLTSIDLNSTDQPLPELLRELDTKYGLRMRLDPSLDADSKTVTFRVQSLAADQAIDLVMKMADLAYVVDAAGEIWITTRDRVAQLAAPRPPDPEPWTWTFGFIRWQQEAAPQGVAEGPRDPPWKGKKVTVSIVRRPLAEAWDALADALELEQQWGAAFWKRETRAKAAAAVPVSLVAEEMPAEQAVAEILRDSGLELDANMSGANDLLTAEAARQRRETREAVRRERVEDAQEQAAFRLRRVRIRGEVLTASDVAGQVAAQLGVTPRIAPEVALCPALWESDGLEQPAGEVLDILARDGELLWRWHGEADHSDWDRHSGPRCLWVLGVVEK